MDTVTMFMGTQKMEKDNAKYDQHLQDLKEQHEILNERIDRLERNPKLHARPEELSEMKKQRLSIKDKLENI
tara:strand:+ start:259 stop:474 length:216 start_codon:yes stop_codon:yes gene_type:complete